MISLVETVPIKLFIGEWIRVTKIEPIKSRDGQIRRVRVFFTHRRRKYMSVGGWRHLLDDLLAAHRGNWCPFRARIKWRRLTYEEYPGSSPIYSMYLADIK